MTDKDWESSMVNALGIFISGDRLVGPEGEPEPDDSFYVILSVREDGSGFKLPPKSFGERWEVVLDTSAPEPFAPSTKKLRGGSTITVPELTVMALRRVDGAA